jgi:hypothetical protein
MTQAISPAQTLAQGLFLGSSTAEAWPAEASRAATYAQEASAAHSKWSRTLWGALLSWPFLGFISLFLITFATEKGADPGLAVLGWGALALGMFGPPVVAAYAWTERGRAGVAALEHWRLEAVAPLLELLAADTPPGTPFSYRLNLRTPPALLNQNAARVGSWTAWRQAYAWGHLGGKFVDGTRFDIRLVDLRERRDRTKRGRSGKTKRKTKVRSGQKVIVRLRFDPARFPALTQAAHQPGWIHPLPGARAGALRATPGALVASMSVVSGFAPTDSRRHANALWGEMAQALLVGSYQLLHASQG